MSLFVKNNIQTFKCICFSGLLAMASFEVAATQIDQDADISFDVDDNFNILAVQDDALAQTMPVSMETEIVESQTLPSAEHIEEPASTQNESKTEVVESTKARAVHESVVDEGGEVVLERGQQAELVKQVLGAPKSRTIPVGEPRISSWVYPDFVVYFEEERVLHTVKRNKSGS